MVRTKERFDRMNSRMKSNVCARAMCVIDVLRACICDMCACPCVCLRACVRECARVSVVCCVFVFLCVICCVLCVLCAGGGGGWPPFVICFMSNPFADTKHRCMMALNLFYSRGCILSAWFSGEWNRHGTGVCFLEAKYILRRTLNEKLNQTEQRMQCVAVVQCSSV